MESLETRIVWLTFIAAMDEEGFVQFASIENVAHRARVGIEAASVAVRTLEEPDLNSSDSDNEGRRIERVPGGWMVLNAKKYRELVTRVVIQEQTKNRVRRFREKKRTGNAHVTPGNENVTPSEADTDSKTRAKRTNARAETVAESSMRLATQNGYRPEPSREGKLLDSIECRQCGRSGFLVSQAPRNGHPVQFYCRQASGGCGFSLPAKFATEILSQMTPSARKAIEAMIPPDERPYESPGMILTSELKFDEKGMLIE